MRGRLLIILFLFILNVRCGHPEEEKTQQKKLSSTEIFNSYLQRKFDLSIPDSIHYFILIPKFGCIACMQKGLTDLNQIITSENTDRFTYIVSNRLEKVNRIYEDKPYQILTDSSGELDLLNLKIADLMVLKTLDGEIRSTFHLRVDNISEFPGLFSADTRH